MSAYAHGVLTTIENRTGFEWRVLARSEMIDAEKIEDELGPMAENYELHIASVGSRGWRMIQVVPVGSELQFWFERELPAIEMPDHDTVW